MSKYARVAPPQVLKWMKDEGILGYRHLLLAHDVEQQRELYTELFHDVLDHYIIMDNSSAELKQPADFNMVSHACSIVHPDVIILPDVINDSAATLQLTEEACRNPSWELLAKQQRADLFAVPQGKTLTEYMQCVDKMLEFPNIHGWCVPKAMFWNEGTRQSSIAYLRKISHKPIHLLGFSDSMPDDIASAKMPGVMSIDSAVPIWMGQRHERVDRQQKVHGKRGDFWQNFGDSIMPETIVNIYDMDDWF